MLLTKVSMSPEKLPPRGAFTADTPEPTFSPVVALKTEAVIVVEMSMKGDLLLKEKGIENFKAVPL